MAARRRHGLWQGFGALFSVLALGACSSVGMRDPHAGGASPPESYRQNLLLQAMSGLLYLEDRVVPDPAAETPPPLNGEERAALQVRVEGLLRANRTIEAIGLLVRLIVDAPAEASPYERLGQALVLERRTPEALAAFLTAVRLDDQGVSARFAAAGCLGKLGRDWEEITALEAILADHPDHGWAHSRLAAALALAGDLDGARDHLAAAQRLGAPVPMQLSLLLATGDVPRAVVRDGAAAGTLGPLVGPQVRVNTNGASARANETTGAAIVDGSGDVVAGWNDYREPGRILLGAGLSLDGGVKWDDWLLRAPTGHQADVEGDPMSAADARTGTLWLGGMSWAPNGGVFVARKRADSPSFEPPVMTYVDGGIDKGWLAAGPAPGDPDSTRVYVAYNYGLQRSTDLGDTWSPIVDLGMGLGFLPRVGPAGELYIAYWDCWDGMWVSRSFDGGQTVDSEVRVGTLVDTWDIYDSTQVPGDFRAPNLCYLAVSPVNGTLYAVWADVTPIGTGAGANVDLYFTRSTDRGTTWATPWIVGGAPGDQFFPWLEADEKGRLHLLFYDTRNTPQLDDAPSARIDAYYAWSDDGGDSWTEYRLTPVPFDSSYTDQGTGQFIGDYLGAGIAGSAVLPVYLSTQNGIREIFTHRIVFPEDVLFADGFDSGDTSAWSATVP